MIVEIIENEIQAIIGEINRVIDNNEKGNFGEYLCEKRCKYAITIEDFQEIIEGIISTLGTYLNVDHNNDYYFTYKDLKITIEFRSSFKMSKRYLQSSYIITFADI